MRLGRASMRCGSCSAVVAVYTLTLSPPSSCARAPHSGTVAKTPRSAATGLAHPMPSTRAHETTIDLIAAPSVLVGAVGAQAEDVLQHPLVVPRSGRELAARVLQAQAR